MGLFNALGTLFGGGNQNANFSAQSAPIYQIASPDQVQGAYSNAQQGLANQNSLNSLLAAQNGIGNQSSVYSQQQDLANALLAQSHGTGPNPAQAALNQNTGANIASQAALMAGQRGAGANVGLMSRQIANQGANTQQQAVGQGAIMQAQQQLAAQQALMQQQAQMANLATTQVGQQQSGINNFASNSLNEQSLINNAALGYNNSNVANQGNMNSANQAMAGINAGNTAKILAGGISGASSVGMQQAGLVPAPKPGARGGVVSAEKISPPKGENPKLQQVPKKDRFASGGQVPPHLQALADIYHSDKMACGGMAMNQGGKVDALVSPGEKYLPPRDVEKVKQGANPMEVGENIPGKAKVAGNSLKNDTVPKKLDPGGVVLPRSVTESKDADSKAKQFVAQLLNKYGDSEMGGGEDEFREALKKAISSRRSA